MNFYTIVTNDNAIEWFNTVPAHLRKSISDKLSKFLDGANCSPSDNELIYSKVKNELGVRPNKLPIEQTPGDGYTSAQLATEDKRKSWCARYDELQTIDVVLGLAQTIQNERKLLSQALGLAESADGFPAQSVGLDDTQAATVRWIQSQGQTPLEFLVETYRDPEIKAGDRINAAKAMLDFVHRKIPQKTEVETKDITEPKIDPKSLKGLSDKEMATLDSLLKKMGA